MLEFSLKLFAEKLLRVRKSYGITQAEFSERIGCKRATYARYESGNTAPPLSIVYKISKEFGVSADDLLDPGYHAFKIDKNIKTSAM